ELVAVEIERLVDVGDTDHRVQVTHVLFPSLGGGRGLHRALGPSRATAANASVASNTMIRLSNSREWGKITRRLLHWWECQVLSLSQESVRRFVGKGAYGWGKRPL